MGDLWQFHDILVAVSWHFWGSAVCGNRILGDGSYQGPYDLRKQTLKL